MKRTVNAVWKGSLKEGEGQLTTPSKVLNNSKYCLNSRLGDGKSTNQDELLSTAHAGCFAMALNPILGEAEFIPDSLEVTSAVTMDEEKLKLTESNLTLKAKYRTLTGIHLWSVPMRPRIIVLPPRYRF